MIVKMPELDAENPCSAFGARVFQQQTKKVKEGLRSLSVLTVSSAAYL
jgi:hypothetical protein